MRCLLLAAGASRRLRAVTRGRSKCLLPFGGKPLLQRTIEAVVASGISDIGVVTGYRSSDIRSFLASAFPELSITFFHNPSYATTNNLYSLFQARSFLLETNSRPHHGRGRGLLLLDSDILFGRSLVKFLLAHRSANRVAVRVSGPHDSEEIKVTINRHGRILRIGKDIPLDQSFGESIGVEILSIPALRNLVTALERRLASGSGRTEFYEAAFQDVIDGGTVLKAVDVSAYPVAEIDTPGDLLYAQRVVLPMIDHA